MTPSTPNPAQDITGRSNVSALLWPQANCFRLERNTQGYSSFHRALFDERFIAGGNEKFVWTRTLVDNWPGYADTGRARNHADLTTVTGHPDVMPTVGELPFGDRILFSDLLTSRLREVRRSDHSHDRRFSISAVLDPGDPAPAGATLRVADEERGVEYADYVSYRYRPDIADGRLPSSIHFSEHHSIEVLAITFGATSSALPKEAFMPPPELLALDRLSHVVESNRTLYRVLSDGRLAALDARSAERQLRSGPSAARGPVQWVFIGTFAGLSLILVVPDGHVHQRNRTTSFETDV